MEPRLIRLSWLPSVIIGMLMACPAFADSIPLDHLKTSLASVQQVLVNPDLAGPTQLVQRRKLMRVVLQQLFDFDEMSRRSLGANARRNKERMGEFTPLFVDFLEHNYMGILEANGDAKIEYVREIKNDDYVQINTQTRLKDGREFRVDYRLHAYQGGWWVYDVGVEGISLVNNYRSQFDRILNKHSFDDLLRTLREKRDRFN